MKKILLIILGVMGAAGLTRVQAQLINVNFIDDSINVDYGGGNNPVPSAMSGAAVIGSAGDTWNGLGGFAYSAYPGGATFTSGNLHYFNGGVSGVTLTLSAPSGTYDANSPNWGNHSPFSWATLADETGDIGYPYTPYATLMASCLVANSTTATGFVTLSGLTPNAGYNVYTYSASDEGSAGRTSTFVVNGVTQTSTYDGATSTLVEGVDYLEFAGVTASATGTLTINFGNFINSESDFNGFQIEPAATNSPPPPAPPPTVSALSPNGVILCTNTTLECTATSSSNTITITNVQMILTTSTLGGTPTKVTNTLSSPAVTGLGTPTASVNYPLTSNLIYTVVVVATDSNGNSTASAAANFDTLAPTLVIEAEDFNFGGGSFMDTPPDGGLSLYAGYIGEQTIDEQKASSAGTTDYYRGYGDPIITQDANPNNGKEQKYVTAAAEGDTNVLDVPQEVGYNSVGDWLDYTRTFGSDITNSAPAGTYSIWGRLCTDGSGPALNFYQVTNGQGTASQAVSQIGSFSFTDNNWNTYEYVPMLDQFGNLVAVTLSGEETLRGQVTGNPNIDFYMLIPAVPRLTPSLLFAYPDGVHPFEATNNFTFTVGPANGSNIVSTGIDVVLNGVDITSNPRFTLTAAGSAWTGNFPVASNAVYSAVISVTNVAGSNTTISINFDTFDVNNYQWEAVDYDFSTNNGAGAWIGGLFIDNPVPTCDTTAPQTGHLETNSYYAYPTGFTPAVDTLAQMGAVAQQGVDIYFPNDGQSSTSEYYRADGVGSQPAADYLRPKFRAEQTVLGDTAIGTFNIGYYGLGYWLNYTRHYPTNNYYVWGRLAGGGGAFSGTTVSLVTSGVGATNQTTQVLGTFSDPNAAGWQAWHWIPLLDANGNMVNVSLGGLATLRVTSGNNVNSEFFMLAPAPPQFTVTPSLVAGQLNLSFPTQSGHTYTVVYKSSLAAPTWTPVGSPISGNGSAQAVLQTLTGTQGYYTVTVQ